MESDEESHCPWPELVECGVGSPPLISADYMSIGRKKTCCISQVQIAFRDTGNTCKRAQGGYLPNTCFMSKPKGSSPRNWVSFRHKS